MKMEENRLTKDERLLIEILKKIDLEEPSPHFIDKAINVYSKSPRLTRFRMARLPLILLGVLSSLLFLPMLFTGWAEMTVLNPPLRIFDTVPGITFEFFLWYLVYPLFLLLSLILIVHIELRAFIFQKSKNPII